MAKVSTSPDSAQQGAIDININAVVSAGAGSGKTSVLSKRFTDLLLRDKSCRVDQILTLTFTKKATVEMNSRIYAELSKAIPEKAKDFYKANIKTLDSYCSQVARLGCHYYGISPDFVIDDATIKARVESMALPFILKNRDNEAIKVLVETKEFDVIASQLFAQSILENSTVAEKIDFKTTLMAQYKVIESEWNKICSELLKAYESMKAAFENYPGNKKTNYFTNLSSILENEPIEIPAVNFNEPISKERTEFISYFKSIADVNKSSAKGIDDIKEIHDCIRRLVDNLNSVENYLYGTQYVDQLIPLFEEFQEMVNQTKRSSGMLTYSDASSLALRILIDHPEIRNIEKEKYRYIMIDEFQDNNSMQRDLLFLLAEKKERNEKSVPKSSELEKDKLFFVGDEKQSIYKFRGADVSVFRGLANDFKKGNRELKTNYRSHPALIAAFNTIFGGSNYPPANDEEINSCVFYTQKDEEAKKVSNEIIPDYEAVYHNVEIPLSKIEDITEEEKKKLFVPRVHFALVDKNEPVEDGFENSDVSECYWVAAKIKELLDGKYDNIKYSPNEIAILFRSYSLLPTYERILLNQGIPFISETVKGFYSDGPVNDVMSFLRLVAYPNDKLSFLTILRSPFANLSDFEVKSILTFVDEDKSLFDLDAEICLKGNALLKYKKCQLIYRELLWLVKREKLTKIISYLWDETGYRYETVWNKTVFMYSSAYDRLFELARQADLSNIGISEFVDSIDSYQAESEKLDGMEIPLEASQGVRIMSIHKSKGLEFKVVFICGTGHQGANDSNSQIIYSSKEFGITVNTPANPLSKNKDNYFYKHQKELSVNMSCAELRRVTYVALTRAENRLFITGGYKFSDFKKYDYTPEGEKKPSRILDVLMPALSRFVISPYEEAILKGEPAEGLDTAYSIPDVLSKKCPFTFEKIPAFKIPEEDKSRFDRSNVKNKFKDKYEKALVIEKQEPKTVYVSPSHLHEADDETPDYAKYEIVVDKKIPFSQIDTLVLSSISAKKKEPEFTYSNFGTIAHAYIEWAIKNEEVKVLNKEIVGLHGNEKSLEVLDEICRKMQLQFKESEIGKQIADSVSKNKFYKCEYSFKSLVAEKIINGQIDLVFENADCSGFTIVDYKTNKEVNPAIYRNQLACYRDAIAKMMDIDSSKIRCVLYYLRYGRVEDITDICATVDLEKVVSVAE